MSEKKATIGYYTLDKKLGEGNFAKVKLATHQLTGQKVAIKIIDKQKLDKTTAKKLFREVRIMKSLNHKHIIRLYEVIDTPEELHLVLEYAPGGEVFDYLVAHGRMKEKDARKYFRQMISALHYCHNLHIIHRDLKAENLLLDENMNIKVADFGFSNQFTPGQKLNTWCGSPPYAAPELFQGKEYVGPEVDVWSSGVVLFVLVTGSLPFDGSNLAKLRARVIAGKFKIPFYMSPDCEKLIKKMLVLDPTKRATLEEVMKDKWYTEDYENEKDVSVPFELSSEQHKTVLEEVEELGFDKAAVEKAVKEGIYDSLAATYYLVADKRFRQNSVDVFTPLVRPTTTKLKSKSNLEVLKEEDDRRDSVQKPVQATEVVEHKKEEPPKDARPARPTHRRRATVNATPTPIEELRKEIMAKKNEPELAPIRPPSAKPSDPLKPLLPNITPVNPPPVSLPPIPTARGRSVSVSAARPNIEEGPTIPISDIRKHFMGDKSEVRTVRFTFSSNTTSTKPPDQVFSEVSRVLSSEGVQFKVNGLVATCVLNDIEFELEVCRLPNLAVNGLRFRRISGNQWDYKEVLTELIAKLNL